MISTPWLPRMRCSWATSASRGTLSRISVSSLNRPAIINGSAAFFAPEIGMVPLSLLPPTMRMRSMPIPAFCYAQSIGRMDPRWQKREICGYLMGLGANWPSFRPVGAAPGMALEAIDIFAFQHRLWKTVARHPDHGAADLLGGGHVFRRHPVEQRQQRHRRDIDGLNPAGLRPDAVQRLDGRGSKHI